MNLRNLARNQPCTLRLPGCDFGGETTVLAHLPSARKGMGIKSPDWWGVHSCFNCHNLLDRRTRRLDVDRELILERSLAALYETQAKWLPGVMS